MAPHERFPAVLLTTCLIALLFTASLNAQRSEDTAQEFLRVKYVTWTGRDVNVTDAVLRFDSDQLILRSSTDGNNLKIMSFTLITSGQYVYSKNKPWHSEQDADEALVFFMEKKNWFTVRTERDLAVMQLDHGNYRAILTAFERRTGLKFETVREGT